ncbi:MAG: MarR family winged helix-turn-helix transcriptional regulator [Saprospiraceae bacterium]
MKKDLLQELGYRTLDSRLKRISDRIIHDIRAFYKAQGLELEPNWYLIFELLKTEDFVTTSLIVQRTKLAQPSIAAIVKKMMQKGYLESTTDPKDGRIQQLRLTEKAQEQLPFFFFFYEKCHATLW